VERDQREPLRDLRRRGTAGQRRHLRERRRGSPGAAGRPRHHRGLHLARRGGGACARAESRLRRRGVPHPREAGGGSRARAEGEGVTAERRERDISVNRRAFHDYAIDERYEAGLVLTGSEVKSLREGRANLKDAYARFFGDELFLIGFHISPYAPAS